MKKKNLKMVVIKSFLFLVFLIFVFLSLSFFLTLFEKNNFPAVIFFDVGQGDSVLLRNIEGRNILIDGGPDNSVLKKLGQYLPYFSRKIDLIIISHAHDDHVFGLIETSNRYRVDNLILGESLMTSFNQKVLLDNLLTQGTGVNFIKNINLTLSNSCSLDIINPLILEVAANDNNSLMAKLDCYGFKFLFSGDNEKAVELALVKSDLDLTCDVLKASHHGSKTSNIQDFLEKTQASYFIVSVGESNSFGHPAKEVLNRVLSLNMILKRTDLEGDIVFSLIEGR